MNSAHITRRPLRHGSFHTVTQSDAVGEPGQGIESRQSVDSIFGDPSLGDILGYHDDTTVFNGLQIDPKRAPVLQVHDKRAARRKHVFQAVNQALPVDIGDQTSLNKIFHQAAPT